MMPADTSEHLESALARLSASDYVAAFDSLLAAWRQVRASQIAALIENLSARAARHHPPLTSETKPTERLLAWMKAFRVATPLGVGFLIAELEKTFTEGVAARFIFPRIEALAGIENDPRIASVMARTAHHLAEGASWRKFLPQYVRAFHSARDPRFIEALAVATKANPTAPALARGSPLFDGHKALKRLRGETLRDGVPPLHVDFLPVVAAIEKAITAIPADLVLALGQKDSGRDADPVALLADVRANPDDYELRLILADALTNVGDPLGEFIVLQSRRANGEEVEDRHRSLSRERALLAEHQRAWLGPLISVVPLPTAVFERGFLTRCEAQAGKRVTAEVHFQHPEWATVRAIQFRGEARVTPAMRALREAVSVDFNGLLQLATTGHPLLERVQLNSAALWPLTGDYNEAIRLLIQCAKLPLLKQIEIDVRAIRKVRTDWIWQAVWREQIRSVGVRLDAQSHAAWLDELRRNHLEEVSFFEESHRIIIRKRGAGLGLALFLQLDHTLPSSVVADLAATLRALQKSHSFDHASFLDDESRRFASKKDLGTEDSRLERTLARMVRG